MEPTVKTDRTVSNNRPDSVMCCNKQGTYMSTDVAISVDRDVIKKGAEKNLIYE